MITFPKIPIPLANKCTSEFLTRLILECRALMCITYEHLSTCTFIFPCLPRKMTYMHILFFHLFYCFNHILFTALLLYSACCHFVMTEYFCDYCANAGFRVN